MTQQQIQEQAEKYADSIVPNPSKYDAPFHTTRDRHDDITQTWEDCTKWMLANKKAISTKEASVFMWKWLNDKDMVDVILDNDDIKLLMADFANSLPLTS